MGREHVRIPQKTLAEFCRRNYVRRLAVFGSALRDDFGPESDVDVLVEFDEGHVPGLLTMAGLEAELSRIMGRKVDLRTAAELSRHFREQVLREAENQYVAA